MTHAQVTHFPSKAKPRSRPAKSRSDEYASAERKTVVDLGRALAALKRNTAEILEHKKQLERVNGCLDVALNNMARGLSMFDADGRLIICNALYREIYHLPARLTRPGTPLADIVRYHVKRETGRDGPEEIENQRRWIKNHLAELARGATFTETQHLKDGRIVLVTNQPLYGGGWVDIQEDITEKRHAEEKIRKLALVVERTSNGVVIADAHGRVEWVNESYTRLTGYALKEIKGKTPGSFVHGPETDQAVVAEIKERLQNAQPVQAELLNYHKTGRKFWVATRIEPICSSDGSVETFVSVQEDITERKLHEQMKEQFIATVSHELRTPLTSILGSIALVAAGAVGPVPESAARLLKIARTNCDRLVSLINDILDLEKIEFGKMVFHLGPVDVRALVAEEIAAIRGFAEGYGVRIRFDHQATHSVVHADAHRLAQVVSNLLSNAIKFSPRGAEVVVRVKNRDGMVRICVRDHGRGIPEEFKDRVFEKFVQVDANDSRQRGGTGLGLCIVKQIVERLNGEVSFEPAPGGGTAFCVMLPCWEEGMETGSGQQQRA